MNDGNIWLEFNVTGEKVIRTDNNRIASGTRNTVKARFKMLNDWVGSIPIAIFSKGIIQKQVLTVNGECNVPNEFMRNEGHFSICVYGGDFKTTVTEKSSIAVVRSGFTPDEELISADGGDVLSFVKSLDNRIQFIREAPDGLFEYSLDGAVWRTVEIAWVPSYSDDGLLTWERKITSEAPEPMYIKGEKGEKGNTGETGAVGPKGEQGEPGIVVRESGAAEFSGEALRFLHPAKFVYLADEDYYVIVFNGAARFEIDVMIFPEHVFIRNEGLPYNVLVMP